MTLQTTQTPGCDTTDWVLGFFARAKPDAELDAAREMVRAAEGVVRVAHGMAVAGRRIDLRGLEDRIGRVTAGVLDLVPEDGRRVRPDLVALLGELDRLALVLRSRAPPGEAA